MNVLKWPGTIMPGKQPYLALGDEVPSDTDSEEHPQDEKSQIPKLKRGDAKPRRPSLTMMLHVACFTFYTALFFVLSVSSQKECADDQTQVWCKSAPPMNDIKLEGARLSKTLYYIQHRPDHH